jgi:hypothetical protein
MVVQHACGLEAGNARTDDRNVYGSVQDADC